MSFHLFRKIHYQISMTMETTEDPCTSPPSLEDPDSNLDLHLSDENSDEKTKNVSEKEETMEQEDLPALEKKLEITKTDNVASVTENSIEVKYRSEGK